MGLDVSGQTDASGSSKGHKEIPKIFQVYSETVLSRLVTYPYTCGLRKVHTQIEDFTFSGSGCLTRSDVLGLSRVIGDT